MADTTFVDQQTVVEATWLNDLNDFFYTTFDGAGSKAVALEAIGGLGNVTNVGTGEGEVARGTTNAVADFKTLKAGSNIIITNNADEVLIQANSSISNTAALTSFDNSVTNQYVAIDVQDALDELVPFSGAKADLTSSQAIPDVTTTMVSWDAAIFDTNSYLDLGTDDTRFTIPAGVSRVRLSTNLTTVTGTSAVSGAVAWHRNGSPYDVIVGDSHRLVGTVSTAITTQYNCSGIVDVVPGDYFQVSFTHDGGGSVSLFYQTLTPGSGLTWASIEKIA